MQRLIPILMGLLLFGAAIATLAQETEGAGIRKIVSQARPVYPDLARKNGIQGSVKLLVTVAPGGTVKSVQTLGGNPVLAKAAEDSVYKFRWMPTQQESKELVEMRFH